MKRLGSMLAEVPALDVRQGSTKRVLARESGLLELLLDQSELSQDGRLVLPVGISLTTRLTS